MQLISIDNLESISKDVTLQNGAKHRCIDATQIYELPKMELVRCKDCAEWHRISITKDGNCYDHMIERRTKEDDYCSHAIKKDGEQE